MSHLLNKISRLMPNGTSDAAERGGHPVIGLGSHTVRMTADVYRLYKESIATNPPETFALLGGRLDDPFLITDFCFLPPLKQAGGYVQSAAYVYPDHEMLNYIVDRVFVPNGKYMLGLWHSHPGGYTQPSAQDLDYCSDIIANDDSQDRAWRYFIAPITTINANGRDHITTWILKKGTRGFERASIAIPQETTIQRHDVTGVLTPINAAFEPNRANDDDCAAAIGGLLARFTEHGAPHDWMKAYRLRKTVEQAAAMISIDRKF